MDVGDDSTPGWDAIDRALDDLYAGVEPQHWGTIVRWRMGGPDPLDGTSAYDAGDHWHYVSYGMTELYGKESENAAESGWGFEFTFRLRKAPGEEEPPVWAVNLLQNLGRYVYRTGNWFDVGHKMGLNGPIAADHPTAIGGVIFVQDPQLAPIDTPNGRVAFLQVVGVTDDERLAAARWNTLSLADLMKEREPLLVTDLERESRLADPTFATAVEAGIATDGSSNGFDWIDRLETRIEAGVLHVTIGAIAVDVVCGILPGRIPFGRDYTIRAPGATLAVVPTDGPVRAEPVDGGVRLHATAALARSMAATLRPQRGTWRFDGVVVEVVPTEITNGDGEVVGVIG